MKVAQDPITRGELETIEGSAGLRFAGGGVGDIVSLLLRYLFPIAGLLLLLFLLYGGYLFMFSRGDPKATQQAKSVITSGVIGFSIVFVSYWLVRIVAIALGLQPVLDIFQ